MVSLPIFVISIVNKQGLAKSFSLYCILKFFQIYIFILGKCI